MKSARPFPSLLLNYYLSKGQFQPNPVPDTSSSSYYPFPLMGGLPFIPYPSGRRLKPAPAEAGGEGIKNNPTAISANNKPCAFAHEPNATPTCITGVLRKNKVSSQFQPQHRPHHRRQMSFSTQRSTPSLSFRTQPSPFCHSERSAAE